MPVSQNFINQIKSTNVDVRFGAARSAWQQGTDNIVPLADLMAADDAGVAKSAKMAAEAIVHRASRPNHADDAAKASAELLKVAADGKRLKRVRGQALEWLGFVATGSNVNDISELLTDADVREEARMALERIPGEESLAALQAAGLEQSVANRKATSKTIGTVRSFATSQPTTKHAG